MQRDTCPQAVSSQREVVQCKKTCNAHASLHRFVGYNCELPLLVVVSSVTKSISRAVTIRSPVNQLGTHNAHLLCP
jgi:hypothetical protein